MVICAKISPKMMGTQKKGRRTVGNLELNGSSFNHLNCVSCHCSHQSLGEGGRGGPLEAQGPALYQPGGTPLAEHHHVLT